MTVLKPTANQFIAGEPIEYLGYDGKRYIAHYHPARRLGDLASMRIVEAETGRLERQPIMEEHEALSFFHAIERDDALVITEGRPT